MNLSGPLMQLIAGLVFIVIGLALGPTVISSAVTFGTATGIGSFGGVQGIGDLVPLIFIVGVLIGGITLTISGYRSMRGRH